MSAACLVALAAPTALLLLGGILVLFLERKFIAIAQKRLGISFLGRNGWAHLPADLIKFWLKFTHRHQANWLTSGLGVVGAILSYLVWSLAGAIFFIADGGTGVVDMWDFQLLVYFAYASLSSLHMFVVVVGTRSKYATLAAARLLLAVVSLEIFFMLVFLVLYAHGGGFTFDEVALSGAPIVTAMPPLACWLGLYALFEAKRAPFDHSEAESELVAGHMVEFGGRALLFFYICEYIHLFFCVYLLVVLIFGAGACWPVWWAAGIEAAGYATLCG